MRESTLPVEFSALQSKVHYVVQVSHEEWSSSCPQCGGAPHKSGTYPDRFRMWTNARGKNKVMGWCRRCNYVWFPDNRKPFDPEEFERWRKEQIEIEEQRKKDAERALENLRSEHLWTKYHDMLSVWARDVIHSWGISDKWADHWRLGFNPDYIVKTKEDVYHSPAITIPVWQLGEKTPANIKLRILNPRTDNDRYRNLYKMGTAKPFYAFNALTSKNVFVVEGEKKAMVVGSRLWELGVRDTQVVGVPTKTPDPECIQQMQRYDRAVICLDPDASQDKSLERLVDLMPCERVAVVELPAKIDDMVVQNDLDIPSVLKYAKIWR
jgi:hypothetical protein